MKRFYIGKVDLGFLNPVMLTLNLVDEAQILLAPHI